MNIVRRTVVPTVVALAALAGPTALAHASDTSIKAAIAKQDQALTPSKALTKFSGEKKIGVKQLPAALKVISSYEPKLVHAAKAVAAETPSSAKGRAGQKAWVAGVRQIALEYRDIEAELRALEHDNRSAAAADLKKGLAALNRGKKLLAKADKLLGLPNGA
jgi:hypothetical protein